jgi:hypothetical protein
MLTLNTRLSHALSVWLVGCELMAEAWLTDNAASREVALPALFETVQE